MDVRVIGIAVRGREKVKAFGVKCAMGHGYDLGEQRRMHCVRREGQYVMADRIGRTAHDAGEAREFEQQRQRRKSVVSEKKPAGFVVDGVVAETLPDA